MCFLFYLILGGGGGGAGAGGGESKKVENRGKSCKICVGHLITGKLEYISH